MKKCPFCAEEIMDDAVKCKHCGEMLTKQASNKNEHGQYITNPKKGKRTMLVAISMFLLSVPFCAVGANTDSSPLTSIGVVIFFAGLVVWFAGRFKHWWHAE